MIGSGRMAASIAPDFAAAERLELVAVSGRDMGKARAFAASHNIALACTVDELLADKSLDLIYIATSIDSHAPLTRRALEAGFAVLVEKTIAQSKNEAAGLFALAQERQLFLMEAMWMRFNPVIRAVVQAIADGSIGDARRLVASFGYPQTDPGSPAWKAAAGGGSLLDQGVYPIALADLVLGTPDTTHVVGTAAGIDGLPSGVDSDVTALLGYADGRAATVSSSLRTLLRSDASVAGSAGRIDIEGPFWAGESFTLSAAQWPPASEEFRFERQGNGYVPMLDGVVEALDAGWTEHPLSDHAASLRVLHMIDTIRAAISGA